MNPGSASLVEDVDDSPNIPAGWKPTKAEPVPVIRCTVVKDDGERCRRWSLRGTHVCYVHGGQLPSVRQHAEAVVESARLRIIGNTDAAVDVLEELMQPGTSENVRLKSATEVLDRAGVRGGVDIYTESEITVNPSELLFDRLSTLRDRSKKAQEVFGEIIEAEVVPDALEDGQQTLFDM